MRKNNYFMSKISTVFFLVGSMLFAANKNVKKESMSFFLTSGEASVSEVNITATANFNPCSAGHSCIIQDDTPGGEPLTCSSSVTTDYTFVRKNMSSKVIEFCKPSSSAYNSEYIAPSSSIVGIELSSITLNSLATVSETDVLLSPFKMTSRVVTSASWMEPGKVGVGSASLVGSKVVLTAAHVLFDKENSRWVDSANFAPAAYNKNDSIIHPFGSKNAKIIYIPRSWFLSTEGVWEDYGFAVLESDFGIGYFGLRSISNDNNIMNKSLYLIGYPDAIEPAGRQSTVKFYFRDFDQGYSDHSIVVGTFTSIDGMSGGPVFLEDNYVFGVNVSAYSPSGCGIVRLNNEAVSLAKMLRVY